MYLTANPKTFTLLLGFLLIGGNQSLFSQQEMKKENSGVKKVEAKTSEVSNETIKKEDLKISSTNSAEGKGYEEAEQKPEIETAKPNKNRRTVKATFELPEKPKEETTKKEKVEKLEKKEHH